MRLPLNLRFDRYSSSLEQLTTYLHDLISRSNTQLNGVSEGKLSAIHNAQTTAPITGTHSRGDFVRNSEPSELGAASSKYVVFGWVCVSGGEPGTWVEFRVLTGN